MSWVVSVVFSLMLEFWPPLTAANSTHANIWQKYTMSGRNNICILASYRHYCLLHKDKNILDKDPKSHKSYHNNFHETCIIENLFVIIWLCPLISWCLRHLKLSFKSLSSSFFKWMLQYLFIFYFFIIPFTKSTFDHQIHSIIIISFIYFPELQNDVQVLLKLMNYFLSK